MESITFFFEKVGGIQSLNLQKVDHINHQRWPKKVCVMLNPHLVEKISMSMRVNERIARRL